MGSDGIEEKEEQNVAPSTKAREAYFVDFAKAMQEAVTVPLMVTGGFRTRSAMESALASGAADLIGLGRPMCVMTDAPKQLMEGLEALPRYEDRLRLLPRWLGFLTRFPTVRATAGFATIFWFYEQLENLGKSGKTDPRLSVFRAFRAVEARNKRILAARRAG